jgi:hypothetical protein
MEIKPGLTRCRKCQIRVNSQLCFVSIPAMPRNVQAHIKIGVGSPSQLVGYAARGYELD